MSLDPADEDARFLKLLQTAAAPTSSAAVPSAELAASLGIGIGSSKEEALKSLEQEILAPVRDLSGSELWRWQVYVHISRHVQTMRAE
jgi:hypothetical protein